MIDSTIQLEETTSQLSGLRVSVLVLNRVWRAIKVTDARRALSLLVREAAEVIRVDDGSYATYDLDSWISLGGVGRRRVERNGKDRLRRDEYDWVRAVRFDVAVPKVIRLTGYDRVPRCEMKVSRRNVFARDRHRCQYCRRRFPNSQLSVDHVVPRSQGGANTWENLVCCCTGCNSRKGGRTPDQAAMRLTYKPVQPKSRFMIESGIAPALHSIWRLFLDRSDLSSDVV